MGSSQTISSARTRAWLPHRWHANAWGYLFIAPYLVGLLVFTLGPILGSLGLSFASWDLMSTPRSAGADNYQRLTNDPIFWQSLINTAYYTFVSVPVGILAAFLLAVLVNQRLRGITIFRTIYFLPGLSSIVAVALMWGWLYDGHAGLINWTLELVGIPGPLWLGDPLWAMPAVIIMSIWRGVGFDMVVFLAGLQAIPEEYYEAARIDGANRWHQLRHITLPLLSFTTFFILVTSIIWSFRVFDQTYVLTQGGPDYATVTLVYYIYQHAFQRFNMGYASAMAYILFAITFIVTMLQWVGQRRWVYYE